MPLKDDIPRHPVNITAQNSETRLAKSISHITPVVTCSKSETVHLLEQLPLYMTQRQLAELLGVSTRTLERQRRDGTGIPFTKFGRKVLYAREDVIGHLSTHVFVSTCEARRDVAP